RAAAARSGRPTPARKPVNAPPLSSSRAAGQSSRQARVSSSKVRHDRPEAKTNGAAKNRRARSASRDESARGRPAWKQNRASPGLRRVQAGQVGTVNPPPKSAKQVRSIIHTGAAQRQSGGRKRG